MYHHNFRLLHFNMLRDCVREKPTHRMHLNNDDDFKIEFESW